MVEKDRNDGRFSVAARAHAAGLELESLLSEEELGDGAARREPESLLGDEEQVQEAARLRSSDSHPFFPVYQTIHL